jgi:hypothetical protein
MKSIAKNFCITFLSGLSVAGIIFSVLNLGRAQDTNTPAAPFIIKDTDNDSPGTNIVTRIVTFKAEIGGTQPLQLQWQVDKGNGFVDIPGATNALYRIGNAQVEHNGFYLLTATNSLGGLRTTPQQLIVSEGVD